MNLKAFLLCLGLLVALHVQVAFAALPKVSVAKASSRVNVATNSKAKPDHHHHYDSLDPLNEKSAYDTPDEDIAECLYIYFRRWLASELPQGDHGDFIKAERDCAEQYFTKIHQQTQARTIKEQLVQAKTVVNELSLERSALFKELSGFFKRAIDNSIAKDIRRPHLFCAFCYGTQGDCSQMSTRLLKRRCWATGVVSRNALDNDQRFLVLVELFYRTTAIHFSFNCNIWAKDPASSELCKDAKQTIDVIVAEHNRPIDDFMGPLVQALKMRIQHESGLRQSRQS